MRPKDEPHCGQQPPGRGTVVRRAKPGVILLRKGSGSGTRLSPFLFRRPTVRAHIRKRLKPGPKRRWSWDPDRTQTRNEALERRRGLR